MKQIQRLMASLTALTVALLFTAAMPVYARGDTDAGGGNSNSRGGGSTQTTSSTTTTSGVNVSGSSRVKAAEKASDQSGSGQIETEHATETETETEHGQETETHTTATATNDTSHAELRHKGDDLVASLRQQRGTTTTAAERQKKCEARKDDVSQHTGKLSTRGQQVQTRIDDIFTKAQSYGDSLSTKPDNYDALVASATAAQTTAKNSVSALQTLTPTIDCSSDTAASDVATYKAAVQQARDDLKAYRTAVKNLLNALDTTKTDDSTSQTSGGNQ